MTKEYKTVDKFDRLMGALSELPDVTTVKPTTITTVSPLIGAAQTFIIQTMRQREFRYTRLAVTCPECKRKGK